MHARRVFGAAGLLVPALLVPAAADATPSGRAPIEVIELLGPNGEPLTQASEVNLRGQVIATQGQASFVWEDGEATRLGPPEAFATAAVDISETGQVVGAHQLAPGGTGTPFSWEAGELTELPLSGPDFTDGYAIGANDVDQALGIEIDASVIPNKFRVVAWEDGAVADVLGPPTPLEYVSPQTVAEINQRGQAAVALPGALPTAAVWEIGGDVTPLGTLGGAFSLAGAINEAGAIAGISDVGAGAQRAFLWRDGRMTDLGTLGGTTSHVGADFNNFGWVDRHALNEWGHVVGASTTAAGDKHAFLWRNGRMTDLGTLGGPTSVATAVNNWGQVVGWSTTADGEQHAFLWENGRMTNIGALAAPGRSYAHDINDRGQITGHFLTPEYTARAVLWTASPLR